MDPLRGKTSLSKVFWLYGVFGSLVFGAFEFLLDPENSLVLRLYTIAGLIFSVYVTVATYRCAGNCDSVALAKFVRVSAIITLFLLPVLAYLDLTGALTLAFLGGEQ
jgi:hypothetical protein